MLRKSNGNAQAQKDIRKLKALLCLLPEARVKQSEDTRRPHFFEVQDESGFWAVCFDIGTVQGRLALAAYCGVVCNYLSGDMLRLPKHIKRDMVKSDVLFEFQLGLGAIYRELQAWAAE